MLTLVWVLFLCWMMLGIAACWGKSPQLVRVKAPKHRDHLRRDHPRRDHPAV